MLQPFFTSSIYVAEDGYRWVDKPAAVKPLLETLRRVKRSKAKLSRFLVHADQEIAGGVGGYDAFVQQPALYANFARLPIDEQAILEFCNAHGAFESADSEPVTFADYENQILDMRDAIELWEAIRDKNDELLNRHVRIARGKVDFCSPLAGRPDSTGKHPSEIAEMYFERGDNPADHRGAAIALLDYVLILKMCREHELSPTRIGGALRFHVKAWDLLETLWLQFAATVAGNKRTRDCEFCGNAFEVSPQVNRVDRVFCSDSCRVLSYRRRKVQAAELAAAKMPIREIARKVGSDVETVKKWLKSEGK